MHWFKYRETMAYGHNEWRFIDLAGEDIEGYDGDSMEEKVADYLDHMGLLANHSDKWRGVEVISLSVPPRDVLVKNIKACKDIVDAAQRHLRRLEADLRNHYPEWHIYLLKCSDNTLYCGVTNSIEDRLRKHNNGLGAAYTRSRLPVSLAWHKAMGDKSSALKYEHKIKRLSRKNKIRIIDGELDISDIAID